MTRFVVFGTVAAALALFVWQFVSNAALPWHEMTMREFQGAESVVQAVRAAAPQNGVYFAPQGILAAVSFAPDLHDKTKDMVPMMAKQVVINLLVAFILCLVVARRRTAGPLATGAMLGMIGLAAGALKELSDANWYGFSTSYALVNLIDCSIMFFIAGLVLGALARRLMPAAEAAAAEPAGVAA